MTKHKWHKEIKAWADGAEIEMRYKGTDGKWSQWMKAHTENSAPDWDSEIEEYRIKPIMTCKCIVKDCQNHTHEGRFVGELCMPCWDYITNGNGVHSQAYRNAKQTCSALKEPSYLYVNYDT